MTASANATVLAAAFADQINRCTLLNLCVASVCVGGPFTGSACTTNTECDAAATCVANVCAGGPLHGSACLVLDDCNCVSATATANCFTISTSLTYALRVDVANANPPTFVVGGTPVAYNPTISLVAPVPALSEWALLALPLLLLGVSAVAGRARTRRSRATGH